MSSQEPIYIVSGLPRSGTSLMMQMLTAGGLEPVADGIRTADEDNPEGYYELEKVKKLKEDASWLAAAGGQVLKAVSPLLYDLPEGHAYRVIFMRRNMKEILRSQARMLERRGTSEGAPPDDAMEKYFSDHLENVYGLLEQKDHFSTLFCSYNDLVKNPDPLVDEVLAFVEKPLNRDAMLSAIRPDLYRNKVETS